jgi:hypothetical protein
VRVRGLGRKTESIGGDEIEIGEGRKAQRREGKEKGREMRSERGGTGV